MLVRPELALAGAGTLLGILVSRAFGQLSVARARARGFEMLWRESTRSRSLVRLESVEIWAELRNRDSTPTFFSKLEVLASPTLEVVVEPRSGVLPAHSSILVRLSVRALRVGPHGLFGLRLFTVRAPGLYRVPLAFANPFVLEVLPRALSVAKTRPERLKARWSRPEQRLGRALRGEGPDYHELRELGAGDAYHKIAWKPSARRGKLLVVETEREDPKETWVFVELAVDGFSGQPGGTYADVAIDRAAGLALELGRAGDRIGLVLAGARELCVVQPDRGPRHLAQLIRVLTHFAHTADADRADWDKEDIAARVNEHIASLDPGWDTRAGRSSAVVAARARELLPHAPLLVPAPRGRDADDRVLRHYLFAHGVFSPPRSSSDRYGTELCLATALRRVAFVRPRPSKLIVISRVWDAVGSDDLARAFAVLRRRRVDVEHILIEDLPDVLVVQTIKEKVVRDAFRLQERSQKEALQRVIKAHGG